jgi:release factor glutamine methyltransferase
LKLYLKSDSNIKFKGFRLKILKDVFHPKLFFSTSYFYNFLLQKKIRGKKFLEIGSGCGILSMLAHKQGAEVTAIDIDPRAVENTRLNFLNNFPACSLVNIIQSDLFTNIKPQLFDFIVINPPYFFKKVTSNAQYAWYCGANGEYFESLFSGIHRFISAESETYMVLGESCDIARVKSIALSHKLNMEVVHEKVIRWEKNLIFKLYI